MNFKKLMALLLSAILLSTLLAVPASATEDAAEYPVLVYEFNLDDGAAKGSNHMFFWLSNIDKAFTPEDSWIFSYDVMLLDDVKGMGSLSFEKADAYLDGEPVWRDRGTFDENGLSIHPLTDISKYAYQNWYTREFSMANYLLSDINLMILGVGNADGSGTALFKNIKIYDAFTEEVVWEFELNKLRVDMWLASTDYFSEFIPTEHGYSNTYCGYYNEANPYTYTLGSSEEDDVVTDEFSTDAPATDAPATDAPATDASTGASTSAGTAAASGEVEESKGGCGGAIAFAPVALITVLGGAALSMKKRK